MHQGSLILGSQRRINSVIRSCQTCHLNTSRPKDEPVVLPNSHHQPKILQIHSCLTSLSLPTMQEVPMQEDPMQEDLHPNEILPSSSWIYHSFHSPSLNQICSCPLFHLMGPKPNLNPIQDVPIQDVPILQKIPYPTFQSPMIQKNHSCPTYHLTTILPIRNALLPIQAVQTSLQIQTNRSCLTYHLKTILPIQKNPFQTCLSWSHPKRVPNHHSKVHDPLLQEHAILIRCSNPHFQMNPCLTCRSLPNCQKPTSLQTIQIQMILCQIFQKSPIQILCQTFQNCSRKEVPKKEVPKQEVPKQADPSWSI